MEAKHYHLATSLEDALHVLEADPGNLLLGGGLWIKKSTKTANTLVDLSALHLDEIKETPTTLEIGAMVSLRQFETHPAIQHLLGGVLATATGQIMGVALRGQATIGGTIAGRFAFSDMLTALMLVPVTLHFYPKGEMSLADFLASKGKVKAILTHITIKKVDGLGYFKKVANTVLDFAILNIAVAKIEKQYVIAIGARPAGVELAHKASAYLAKIAKPTADDFAKAGILASEELTYLTTTTASDTYRKTLVATYVRRGLSEVSKHAS